MSDAIKKSAKSLWNTFPVLLSVLLFIGIINSLLTKDIYNKIFGHGTFLDSITGATLGSISSGAPINSYILGGEFLKNGVNLIVVTSFIVAWVTVGFIQLPIEGKELGMKFAIVRNVSAFFLSIMIAIIVNLIINLWI